MQKTERVGFYAPIEPSDRSPQLARSLRAPGDLVVIESLRVIEQGHPMVSMAVDELGLYRQIRAPGLVAMRDVFVAPHGPGQEQLCTVHEYVPSWSLEALLALTRQRREPVPVSVAISLTLDVLATLEVLHDARDRDGRRLGLLLRTFCPGRVLVGTDGQAFVWNLPASQFRAGDRAEPGSLRHWSPESVAGKPLAVTCDVYSVGSVLWEVLAGRPRLQAESVLGLLSAVLHGPPVVGPSRWRPELPRELDELVVRCLSREPRDRPAGAGPMAGELTSARSAITRRQGDQAAKGSYREPTAVPALAEGRAGVAQWASTLGAEPWPGPEAYRVASGAALAEDAARETGGSRPYR